MVGDRLISIDADPAPLFEAVGALMRLIEAARVVVEGYVKPPYGVEAAGLHIDIAHGVVAEYKGGGGGDPVRIIYSPELEEAGRP